MVGLFVGVGGATWLVCWCGRGYIGGLLVGVGGAAWLVCWCGRGCMVGLLVGVGGAAWLVCLLMWEGLHEGVSEWLLWVGLHGL